MEKLQKAISSIDLERNFANKQNKMLIYRSLTSKFIKKVIECNASPNLKEELELSKLKVNIAIVNSKIEEYNLGYMI